MAAQGSNDISPLTEEETRKLVDACFEAKSKAHAPYSKFRVGSALLTEDGTMYTGTWVRCTISVVNGLHRSVVVSSHE